MHFLLYVPQRQTTLIKLGFIISFNFRHLNLHLKLSNLYMKHMHFASSRQVHNVFFENYSSCKNHTIELFYYIPFKIFRNTRHLNEFLCNTVCKLYYQRKKHYQTVWQQKFSCIINFWISWWYKVWKQTALKKCTFTDQREHYKNGKHNQEHA